MRNTRKGFTLVELLIVVAILATLTAAMTSSISGSTAKAKAAMIANNVEVMKSAATQYYTEYMENSSKLANATTADVLDEYMPTWRDFQTGNINYTAAEDSETGRKKWAVTVDFSSDGEVEEIKTALAKIKGYGDYNGETITVQVPNENYDEEEVESETNPKMVDKEQPAGDRVRTGKFTVTLWNGAITAVTE